MPELAGCAADGVTRQQALANAEIVIAEWIETARELGRPIPEPRGRLLFACSPAAKGLSRDIHSNRRQPLPKKPVPAYRGAMLARNLA